MNELLWWFGQNTLAALLIIPCVLLACRLFRDRPAVQHLLWLVMLLKFVTPPVVVWPWSVDELRNMACAQLSFYQDAKPGPSPEAPIPALAEPRSVPVDSEMVPKLSAPSTEQSTKPGSLPADYLTVNENANEETLPTTFANLSSSVANAAILAWFVGAIVCAVSQLRRLARYGRLVRCGEVASSHLKVEVASVASLLNMQAPVSLVVKGIVSPFLWCAGEAKLVWPDALSSQADVVRSRGIIAHELAHLRRRDHWITWVELGASILWWWNPLFWYVRRQLRETAEMSCDAVAIAANPESRREYAELLLRLSSQSTNSVPVPVIAMGAGNFTSFEKRLKMILSSNVSGNLSWPGAVAMAVLAVIALPYWSLAQSTNLEPSPTLTEQSNTAKESRKATEPDHGNDSIAVGEKPDTSANMLLSSTHQFIAATPKHVNFVSSGTSEILNDRSVQLNPTDQWQEYALHFSPADLPSKVSVVQLEILPRDSAQSSNSKPTLLSDVKPHLKQQDGQTVQLDFSKCTFTGDVNDDLTVHCIDYLSDTGWQVPEFTDKHRVHHLLLHLEKPVEMENVTDFALTIDAGGAGQFSAVSRVRVSFADATSRSANTAEMRRQPGTRKTITLNDVSFSFRWCPSGEFLMGSPEDKRSQYGSAFVPQHHVRISRGFWLSECEITQAQYEMVTGENPSFWKPFNPTSVETIEREPTTNNPVEQVSWFDASSFCQELAKLAGQHRFRLPTEAEWEYACRAGRRECRYGEINDIAWVFENTEIGVEGSFGHRKVGSKTPNAWGLHDMFGNVSEWCSDWSGPPATQPTVDPTGPTSGELRIARGGNCFADQGGLHRDGRCMAGTRDHDGGPPYDKVRTRGFRIVLVANEEQLTISPGDDQSLMIDPAKKSSVKVDAKPVKPEIAQPSTLSNQPIEVAIAFNSGTALFDLDTEKKLGPMARGAPADVPQFDLYATWRGANQSQLHAQVQRLLRVDDAQWGSATAKNIIATLQVQTEVDSKSHQVLSNANDPTSTWLVQTKQGGIAILSIEFRKDIQTETSGIVEGFVVRYRLVSTVREPGIGVQEHNVDSTSQDGSKASANNPDTVPRPADTSQSRSAIEHAAESIRRLARFSPESSDKELENAIQLLVTSTDSDLANRLVLQLANHRISETTETIDPIRLTGFRILMTREKTSTLAFLRSVKTTVPENEQRRIDQLIGAVERSALNKAAPQAASKPKVTPKERRQVATFFEEPVYQDQLEGYSTHANRLLEFVTPRLTADYRAREKLTLKEEWIEALAKRVWRSVQEKPQTNFDEQYSEEERFGMSYAWQLASMQDWLLTKSLFERYGGRVGFGSLGLWLAPDGRNALIKEAIEAGNFKILDPELEKEFWVNANKKNFADAYPTGEDLKRYLSYPPQLGN